MEILLIEDNEELALFVQKGLSRFGANVTLLNSIKGVLSEEIKICYDVLVLDLILNDENGADLVRHLRKSKINIPILILSSLSDVDNKVDLLNLGADDYMTKPFDVTELNARIDSLYRRYLDFSLEDEEVFGDTVFYWKQNRMKRSGRDILFTKKEGDLMRYLVQHRGKNVRSEDILRKIWGVDSGYHSNILQSMVRRLRRKIDQDFDNQMIKNIHGFGYFLDLPKK